MICKHCGKEIDEKETCCPHCFKYTEKGELALTRLAGMKPPSKRTNEPAFGYAEDGHHTARHTCKQCGKILRDGAQVCPDCGTQTELAKQAQKENAVARARGNVMSTATYYSTQNSTTSIPTVSSYSSAKLGDAPSVGYAILGFLIPIVGLILFLTWKQDYPQRAASAGKGALVSVILEVIVALIGVSCVACTVCSLIGETAYVPTAIAL